jgi:hypothetical protein
VKQRDKKKEIETESEETEKEGMSEQRFEE